VIAGQAGNSTVSTERGPLDGDKPAAGVLKTRFYVFFAVLAVLSVGPVRQAGNADLSAGHAEAPYCLGLNS
jgi:hypothetical protein